MPFERAIGVENRPTSPDSLATERFGQAEFRGLSPDGG